MRRRTTSFLLIIAGVLVGGLCAARFLASWVPTKGKVWLEEELERQLPIDVAIGAIRYEPFRGVLLEQVRAVERTTQEPWVVAPLVRVQVAWLPLFLRGEFIFRASALLELPCHTLLEGSGHYSPRRQSLALEVRTEDVGLDTIAAPLRRHIPPPLTDGMLSLQLQVTKRPEESLVIAGQVIGHGLVWSEPSHRLRANVTVEGRTSPPLRTGDPWSILALISLRDGTLEGLPRLQTISRLEGTARLTDDTLEIEELSGIVLGSRWDLEGTVAPLAQPAVEVLLSSQAQLAPLAAFIPTGKDAWAPTGTVDVRAVCRGPLQPRPTLDCLVHANVRDATLTGPKLTSPVVHITGSVDYDAIARRLAIERLGASILGEPISTHGTIAFSEPITLALNVTGHLRLDALTGWLPSDGPCRELAGLAALELDVRGPTGALRPTGRVELRDTHVRCATFPQHIDELSGSLLLREDRLDVPHAALRLNDQPVTLTATVTLETIPHLSASGEFPHGVFHLTSRLTPEDLLIDDAAITFLESRVRLGGTLGRRPERASALRVSGAVDLGDLQRFPFFPLPQLEPWHLTGQAMADVELEGRISDWPGASLRGRIQAEHVAVRDLPIDEGLCELSQRDRTLRAHVPSARVADGRFQGDVTIEHRAGNEDYALDAEVSGLQLARLTQLVPAWRARAVTGTASGRTRLSGTWDARATWRGEGWLNASGAQLGDVPLLDKVFHGLFGVLGDRMSLESLRRAEITQISSRWQLSQERISTEDLRLGGMAGTETVAIYAKGSVGLDQTLDFVIEPELSEGTVLEAPATASLASTVLKAAGHLERLRRLIGRHRLTGTLKSPEYRFELSPQEIFKQLAPAPGDLLQNLLDVLR